MKFKMPSKCDYCKEINYPKKFLDFSDGVDIDDEEINKRIKECIKIIDFTKEEDWSTVQSGNTAVFVFKVGDYFEVLVTKNYQTFGCDVKDIIKKSKKKKSKPKIKLSRSFKKNQKEVKNNGSKNKY